MRVINRYCMLFQQLSNDNLYPLDIFQACVLNSARLFKDMPNIEIEGLDYKEYNSDLYFEINLYDLIENKVSESIEI